MKLLTKELLRKLPALYSQEKLGQDAMVQVKYFTPDASWSWYGTEYDPESRLFFGWAINYADPSNAELGYFSLTELEKVRGSLGLPIERDLWFRPTKLAEVIKREREPTVQELFTDITNIPRGKR